MTGITMATGRVLTSPSVVRVSRPGVEVQSPPALTSDFLVIDSSWGIPERPLEIGFIPNVTPQSIGAIRPFATTYPQRPAVEFVTYIGNVIRNADFEYYNDGSGDNWVSPIIVRTWVHQFQLLSRAHVGDSWTTTPRNWLYFVWRTW